jgi:DNA-binding MarR family transcriptional regulator
LELPAKQAELLEAVYQMGATTPVELSYKLARLLDEVRPELEALHKQGLLKVYPREEGYEWDIFQLTDAGRNFRKHINSNGHDGYGGFASALR